jgi:predicted short-subunit dehydrogenase-like oxidoreductase (DUF2520 family)
MELNSKIAIIGVGRLGGAMALALSKTEYKIKQLIFRHPEKSQHIAELIAPKPEILSVDEYEKISSEIIFIATPDPEIKTVAENLALKLKHKPVVFHASGALSSDVLQNLREIGCRVGSLHPLVSISDSNLGAEGFKDAFFCLEGDAEACQIAQKMVAVLGGKSFSIPTDLKALYHASAVISSGHLVALFSVAIEALAACGLSTHEAQEILFPLVKSTVQNLASQTPAQALTGTFSRADLDTLKRHLEALRENASPEILAVYRQLGIRSLNLAQEQGADETRLKEMMKILMRD